jgi:hypothetical protein
MTLKSAQFSSQCTSAIRLAMRCSPNHFCAPSFRATPQSQRGTPSFTPILPGAGSKSAQKRAPCPAKPKARGACRGSIIAITCCIASTRPLSSARAADQSPLAGFEFETTTRTKRPSRDWGEFAGRQRAGIWPAGRSARIRSARFAWPTRCGLVFPSTYSGRAGSTCKRPPSHARRPLKRTPPACSVLFRHSRAAKLMQKIHRLTHN